jgi:hypothetical protein
MINNVTFDKLKEKFGDKEGFDRFSEIAKLGGFGHPTRDHTGGIEPTYKGGLDIKGLAGVADEKTLAKIQELAGSGEAEKKGKEK